MNDNDSTSSGSGFVRAVSVGLIILLLWEMFGAATLLVGASRKLDNDPFFMNFSSWDSRFSTRETAVRQIDDRSSTNTELLQILEEEVKRIERGIRDDRSTK